MLLPPNRFRGVLAASLIAVALMAGACSGERPTLSQVPDRPPTSELPTTTTVPKPPMAQVAQANAPSITVFDAEAGDQPLRTIASGIDTSVDTTPVVFLVKHAGLARLEVYLPVRPNGSIGWVNKADVTVTDVPYRIEVTISAHRIRVFKGFDVIVDEPVGVGRTDRPTPGGVYYLKELLQPPSPNGPYGPYAYGLSGFSNVLKSFNGGAGVIGIHGTNDPSAIGSDVSSGCIRVNNAVIERLVNDIGLPLGTPVKILA